MLAFLSNNSIEKYPINLMDLKIKYPNVSFPIPLNISDLTSYGVVEIIEEEQPPFNPDIESIEKREPEIVDGQWKISWEIIPHSDEVLEGIRYQKMNDLRGQRNSLLAQTDWVTTMHKELGTNIPAAWKTYLQALRDLPANTSDPANPVWPIKPS
jgi:hypothetical protein